MSIEKNDKIKNNIDKKKLLQELANDIATQFGIDKENTEKLIKTETLSSLDSLKKEFEKNNTSENKLDNKKLEKLFFSLKGALEVVEQSSKIEIKSLKEEVEQSINIENFQNNIEKFLPKELIKKAKNPSNPHEHILGFALGTANSIIATADILYKIGKGIFQAPYHLYMIISGKAEVSSFKNI